MSTGKHTIIANARIVLSDRVVPRGYLVFRDGVVAEIGEGAAPQGTVATDAGGRTTTAGLVDVHTHGVETYLYERSGEDLRRGVSRLARFGTTTVLPTLYSTMSRAHLAHLEGLAAVCDEDLGCHVPGFHLEGPFLALSGAAGRQLPADLGLLRELLAACRGKVRVMSVSPEVKGVVGLIEHLVGAGVAVFLTHTAATAAETRRAVDAGARHATHFYDVFPVPAETEPGVRQVGAVEVLLSDPRCTVDFIADGVHVDPEAIRLALCCKGWGGVALISDSNIGAGLAAGRFETPWGFPVRVSPEDAARIDDPKHVEFGGLAGSSLTMNRAVSNIAKWFGPTECELWSVATSNPARIAGLAKGVGRIEVGGPADVVIWNSDFTPHRTYLGGNEVFAAE